MPISSEIYDKIAVLRVTGVAPTHPVEHEPIVISFELDEFSGSVTSGSVVAMTEGAGTTPVGAIPPAGTLAGTVAGMAPAAGSTRVSIAFYDDASPNISGEFRQPTLTASYDLAVAATFSVTFTGFVCTRTRALQTDDCGVWVAASSGGVGLDNANPPSPFDPPNAGLQSLWIGDVRNGDNKQTALTFLATVVPGTSPPVVLTYEVVNAGFGGRGEQTWHDLTDKISDATAGILGGLYPTMKDAWSAANGFTHILNNLQFADCDGVVIYDQVTFDAQTMLDSTAANGGVWSETRLYPGYDSAAGCGKNSIYAASWTLKRTSLR